MIGFVVNPIAGMGGAVGLKGTDGDAYIEAIKRGAKPVAPGIARRFLRKLCALCLEDVNGKIVVAPKIMGEDYVKEHGLDHYVLPIEIKIPTTAEDTKKCVEKMLEMGTNLIVFVGGDGTARDIASVVKDSVPILGVPSGVKMYSGVFAISPEAAAELVCSFVKGYASVIDAEVADIDEEAFRHDLLRVRLYYAAKTIYLENLITPTKEVSLGEEEAKKAIARYFVEELYDPNKFFILGPGSTIKAIADELGIEKTLLGFDAIVGGKLIAKDVWGRELMRLIEKYMDRKVLVLTPIGGQGFLIGRGNKQLTPEVLASFKREEILIVSTPCKLSKLKYLLIDTGDPAIDEKLSGYYRVVTGYREFTVIKVVPAWSIPT